MRHHTDETAAFGCSLSGCPCPDTCRDRGGCTLTEIRGARALLRGLTVARVKLEPDVLPALPAERDA